MSGFLIVVGIVILWALVIRLITVRRLKSSALEKGEQVPRPGMKDYETSLKWFAEYIEPHLMFIAAVAIGVFTYRLAANQNSIQERQVAIEESRQPVSFSFERHTQTDEINGLTTEYIEVSANDGYASNIVFSIRHYVAISFQTKLGENSYSVDDVFRAKILYYFDIEKTYMDTSKSMIWRSEGNFEYLLHVFRDITDYCSERYNEQHLGFNRIIQVAVRYTSYDLSAQEDYYTLTILGADRIEESEFDRSVRMPSDGWDRDLYDGELSFLTTDWETISADLRSIIDYQMSLPEPSPEDMANLTASV